MKIGEYLIKAIQETGTHGAGEGYTLFLKRKSSLWPQGEACYPRSSWGLISPFPICYFILILFTFSLVENYFKKTDEN